MILKQGDQSPLVVGAEFSVFESFSEDSEQGLKKSRKAGWT